MVRLSRAIFALLMVWILTGCGSVSAPISDSDVSGAWVSQGPEGRVATLTLNPDGTFNGKMLPDRVFYSLLSPKHGGPADWNGIDVISGTWTTKQDATSKQNLVVADIADRLLDAKFYVNGSGPDRTIEYPIGDFDNGNFLIFRRK